MCVEWPHDARWWACYCTSYMVPLAPGGASPTASAGLGVDLEATRGDSRICQSADGQRGRTVMGGRASGAGRQTPKHARVRGPQAPQAPQKDTASPPCGRAWQGMGDSGVSKVPKRGFIGTTDQRPRHPQKWHPDRGSASRDRKREAPGLGMHPRCSDRELPTRTAWRAPTDPEVSMDLRTS